MVASVGTRLPTYRWRTFREATSCSLQPAGMSGLDEGTGLAEGASLGAADGASLGAADGASLGEPAGPPEGAPGRGAPKLHDGTAAVLQAATVAATPVRPAAPATRRKLRRLNGLPETPLGSGSAGDVASGWVVTAGSTGRGTP